MKSDSVEIRLLSCLVMALLCFVTFVAASVASQQNPQQSNQQRPRRVGSEQAPANTNSQPQTKPAGEEVGEGDVVRVETQLVSVPAVVTDRTGHPISGLSVKNFAIFENGKLQ